VTGSLPSSFSLLTVFVFIFVVVLTGCTSRSGLRTRSPSRSSGACQGWRCRCHESPPCRSVLRASLYIVQVLHGQILANDEWRSISASCWRQAKIQWTQVGLHRSEPRLSGAARPSSPICRGSVCNAGLQSSVVVVAWICSVDMTRERQTTTPDSVWQQRLPSTGTNLIIGNKLCPVDVEDAPMAPVIQRVVFLTYKVLHGTAPHGTCVHSFLLSTCPAADGHYGLLAPIVCWSHQSDFHQWLTNHWAFTATGPRVWNTLLENVTTSQSLSTFCQHLKTRLFRKSYPDIIIYTCCYCLALK